MQSVNVNRGVRVALVNSLLKNHGKVKLQVKPNTVMSYFQTVVVSSDKSNLKPLIVFYPRFSNVWFKEYLFSTRGEACKSKKSINCLCFILSFYYNVSLLEEMLIFVKRSLAEKLWIRGNKNFVFFIFFFIFPFPCFYKSL